MKVVILGAGLMGRLLAYELARTGHSVEVFEASGPQALNSAARAAAAMLAPLAESAVAEDSVGKMGLYSLSRWREMLSSLNQRVYFQQQGTLVVWQTHTPSSHRCTHLNTCSPWHKRSPRATACWPCNPMPWNACRAGPRACRNRPWGASPDRG